jgi:hypothetical protein
MLGFYGGKGHLIAIALLGNQTYVHKEVSTIFPHNDSCQRLAIETYRCRLIPPAYGHFSTAAADTTSTCHTTATTAIPWRWWPPVTVTPCRGSVIKLWKQKGRKSLANRILWHMIHAMLQHYTVSNWLALSLGLYWGGAHLSIQQNGWKWVYALTFKRLLGRFSMCRINSAIHSNCVATSSIL